MNITLSDINIKKLALRTTFFLSVFFCLLAAASVTFAAPALLGAGMTPHQTSWAFDRNVYDANKEVTFWLRVQRQGNLSRFGTFDYYFKIQVLRPDGADVWNTIYGFNEEGYAEQKFTFPIFFYERSADRSSPSFGAWKIRTAVVEKDSQREVSVKEYSLDFTDGKKQPQSNVSSARQNGNPFPVPFYQYKQWRLLNWGIGIYDEVSTGTSTYDKEIRVLESRNTFSVKEAINAWGSGHKFGAMLAGPPVRTYVNSNNSPLYLFGYVLKHPGGESDGQNPQYRTSSYCNNPGAALFPFDLRKPGKYRIEFLLRERDKPSWEESSWVPIGGIDFTLTE
ncbi:MAG: hypothetical protein AB2L12_06480 [Smithellaceae bacterium]